ncbi:MAG TPA: choice-of-anchor B family protein, partial [Rhodanobacteraceae bacterium]|nr:choice-of-anchor B family protein [Rhodanobacteraceae bacterium]
ARTLVTGTAALLTFAAADACDIQSPGMREHMQHRPAHHALAPMGRTNCVDGMAGNYPCSNIDLLAFVPLAQFQASSTNSLWGWTDPDSGTEYALIGANNGIAFYDLSTPDAPRFLGKLPTTTGTGSSIWRDVRVYQNHAFVVSDANPGHGLQVFDLTRLRGVETPQTFTEDGHYSGFGSSHTISINETTGYASVAGADVVCPGDTDHGGLQILDIHDPVHPTFVGCVNDAGYTHESQCYVYNGPDTEHAGRDLCFDSNGSSGKIAIVDVTEKGAPVTLSSTPYNGSVYTHQSWLTEDQKYLLLDDELDEEEHGSNARTYIFDVTDLDHPVLVGFHEHPLTVIDHNLYVHGQYVYQSDYEAGVRILRMDNLAQASLTEVAFFDTYPQGDSAQFAGTWNNFRFPGSGNIIATGIDEGFFVLQPHLCTAPDAPANLDAVAAGDHRIDLSWDASGTAGTTYRVERAQGGCGGNFRTIADELADATYSDTTASGEVPYGYRVIASDSSGFCASSASSCVEATTTGTCTAAPIFAGIASATDAGTANCRVDLGWNAASPACGGAASYSVYRSDDPGFVPDASNRIALGWLDTAFADTAAAGGTTHYYAVRSVDGANGAEDDNLVRLAVRPSGPVGDGTFESGAEPGDPLARADTPRLATDAADWETSATRQHTGAKSFWSTATNNLCTSLITPPIMLTAGESSTLSFWTVWDIEAGWDGGVVEITTDGGAHWQRLTPAGGYPAEINQGDGECGIASGDGAFTGTNHFTWSPYEIDLSAFAGETVQARWLYGTDENTTGEGWYVDDIALTHAQVPGECTIDSGIIFVDGFELP